MDHSVPGAATASPSAMPLDSDLKVRLDAVRAEEEKRRSLGERIRRERRVLLPMLGLCVLALPNFRVAEVQGRSMEPTFHTGDKLILLKSYRAFSPLKVGDIIVIKLKHGRTAGEEIVKRVVFIQNEKGTLLWPGVLPAGNRIISADAWYPQYTIGTPSVPPGGIIVMGDNVMNSMDSRDFGPVYDYEIEGKVIRS